MGQRGEGLLFELMRLSYASYAKKKLITLWCDQCHTWVLGY